MQSFRDYKKLDLNEVDNKKLYSGTAACMAGFFSNPMDVSCIK